MNRSLQIMMMRAAAAVVLVSALGGCAILRDFQPSVKVESLTAGEYIALQRGDILTSGRLSARTTQTIGVAALDADACAADSLDCIGALSAAQGVSEEDGLSALAELWLQHAMAIQSTNPGGPGDAEALAAWLEVARYAYAYLFFTPRTPGQRAFEDRQTQVRDWYNHAVQQASTQLFDAWLDAGSEQNAATWVRRAGDWTLRIEVGQVRLPEGVDMPYELLPASSLSFQGLRSTYRRDGFGAELVAVMEDPMTSVAEPEDDGPGRRRAPLWSEMPSPNLTVLFRFEGEDLAGVLASRQVWIEAHDPYIDSEVTLHGQQVPLAANFTAGYGLWLARSGFNRQSLRTLFGREQGIERPHLYMMQPFDPDRRIVLMLHGLASSPEAWVNVANEILGDEDLRAGFQVWQVYYPTNMPVALNHAAIRRLVSRTLDHFDPDATASASRDMVLIGHSMGGVIARLMVSSADEELVQLVENGDEATQELLQRFRPGVERMLRFEPFPGIERAVFIAAPHRGTEVAGGRAGRWIARLVRLPLTLLESFGEIMQIIPDAHAADGTEMALPNSIDNLDRNDPFVQASAQLPIRSALDYHSIIARDSAEGALEDSSDGLVPYLSAHLPGAVSEKVVVSGHSVQETAPAILEIRRILHQHLAAQRPQTPGES